MTQRCPQSKKQEIQKKGTIMKQSKDLRTMLRAIDHRGYPAYKSLAGAYQFGRYILSIDHVQGDPFASPSCLHAEVLLKDAGFPEAFLARDCARIALQDHLTREMGRQLSACSFKAKGSGKSGLLSISRCGQEVLERSACRITRDRIIMRFHAGFPAFGRTTDAAGLERMLFELLPQCVEKSCFYGALDQGRVREAVDLAEDQEAIREYIAGHGLAAFIADGSVLPRESGVSGRPMAGAVQFRSPESMEAYIDLPHAGRIRGMGIQRGITLIVGGGYHGKSTLLKALQAGVYNHIAGDGREYVITDATAVKLRAEDGRAVHGTDVSMFINNLPDGRDMSCFSTEDASGSTSQAANTVEAMEAGCRLFLIDEDTSATNFMVRDALMQQVVSRGQEPITPFLERARDLYEKAGISTVLIAGSSGAFFSIADAVVQMDRYRPEDITGRVRELLARQPDAMAETHAPGFAMPDFTKREIGHGALKKGGSERLKTKSLGTDSVSAGHETVDVRYLEQLADPEQTAALACMLRAALEKKGGFRSIGEAAQWLYGKLEQEDWEAFCRTYVPCGLAKPRIQEVYACLNRFRG